MPVDESDLLRKANSLALDDRAKLFDEPVLSERNRCVTFRSVGVLTAVDQANRFRRSTKTKPIRRRKRNTLSTHSFTLRILELPTLANECVLEALLISP